MGARDAEARVVGVEILGSVSPSSIRAVLGSIIDVPSVDIFQMQWGSHHLSTKLPSTQVYLPIVTTYASTRPRTTSTR